MTVLSSRWRSYVAVAAQALSPALVIAYLLHLGPRIFVADGVAAMDFQCFWAALQAALTGAPREVYDTEVFRAARITLHGGADAPACMFIYLPLSLLLFLPLAPLTSVAVFAAVLRRIRHPASVAPARRSGGFNRSAWAQR